MSLRFKCSLNVLITLKNVPTTKMFGEGHSVRRDRDVSTRLHLTALIMGVIWGLRVSLKGSTVRIWQ